MHSGCCWLVRRYCRPRACLIVFIVCIDPNECTLQLSISFATGHNCIIATHLVHCSPLFEREGPQKILLTYLAFSDERYHYTCTLSIIYALAEKQGGPLVSPSVLVFAHSTRAIIPQNTLNTILHTHKYVFHMIPMKKLMRQLHKSLHKCKWCHIFCVSYDSYLKKLWVHDRRNHRITESHTNVFIRVGLGNLIRFLQVN